jgi:hypothetical protein
MLGILMVLGLSALGGRLEAQRSCTGPNGCSLTMSVGASVLSTHLPSGARMLVRPGPTSASLQVVTVANTGWALSIGGRDGADGKTIHRAGRTGGTMASLSEAHGQVVVATLVAS